MDVASLFMQNGDLMLVDFTVIQPGYMRAEPAILNHFFPGRKVFISRDHTQWLGVECSLEEWEEFLAFTEYALRQDPNLIGTAQALQVLDALRDLYQEFQRQVFTGSFKSPLEWNTPVA